MILIVPADDRLSPVLYICANCRLAIDADASDQDCENCNEPGPHQAYHAVLDSA